MVRKKRNEEKEIKISHGVNYSKTSPPKRETSSKEEKEKGRKEMAHLRDQKRPLENQPPVNNKENPKTKKRNKRKKEVKKEEKGRNGAKNFLPNTVWKAMTWKRTQ